MPITQDRIIAILEAAVHYRNLAITIYNSIQRETELAQQEMQTYQQACFTIGNSLDLNELSNNKYEVVIAMEMDHFRRTKHSNERAAEKQRIKRNSAHPRTSRPAYIIEGKIQLLPHLHDILPNRAIATPSTTNSSPIIAVKRCDICDHPLDDPYCGMIPSDVEWCPHRRPADPNYQMPEAPPE